MISPLLAVFSPCFLFLDLLAPSTLPMLTPSAFSTQCMFYLQCECLSTLISQLSEILHMCIYHLIIVMPSELHTSTGTCYCHVCDTPVPFIFPTVIPSILHLTFPSAISSVLLLNKCTLNYPLHYFSAHSAYCHFHYILVLPILPTIIPSVFLAYIFLLGPLYSSPVLHSPKIPGLSLAGQQGC